MMSEFFVKLVLVNIKRAYESLSTEASRHTYFFELLITMAVEKIRECIVKEADLESRKSIMMQQ
jgi:hypothetical protein